MLPIKISFSTLACPDWTWKQIVEQGVACGYDGVEVRLVQNETNLLKRPEFQPTERTARRAELDSHRFQVCGLASSVRFDYEDAETREEQVRVGFEYLDLAKSLGAGMIRVFGDVFPKEANDERRSQIMDQIAAGLKRLGDRGQQVGVDVLIETHGDFAETQLMVELMRRVNHSGVGVLWDTHHPWRFFGEKLEDTYRQLKPWVRHTHWKDSVERPYREPKTDEERAADERARGLMSGHRPADYVLFCGGEFPALECLRLLLAEGYSGWFSLEWEKAWHPEIEPPEIALPLFPKKMRWLQKLSGTADS